MISLSNELTILSAFCKDREIFEIYGMYIKDLKNLERETRLLFNVIEEFYNEFKGAEAISKEEFIEYYSLILPDQRDRNTHLDLIHNIYQRNINADLVMKVLESVLERHYASIVMTKVIPMVEGGESGKLIDVYQDIEEYFSKLRNPPRNLKRLEPCELSLEELIASEIEYEGLHWHLPILDRYIGRVKRKTLGLVYAFVDSGKSSFCLAACASFARQLVGTEAVVVYAGNEEAAAGLSLRLTQSIIGQTQTQIVADIRSAEEARRAAGFYNVKLYDSVNHLNDVVYLLDEHKPRVMFIDQAVKVEGDKNDREMKAIQKLFNTYRELAKLYDTTIIGVAQGRGECEDKKYLELSDIYGSRVAIQGELDWALGIGRRLDAAYEDHRYINIPKNKAGDNYKFATEFNRHLCSWREI